MIIHNSSLTYNPAATGKTRTVPDGGIAALATVVGGSEITVGRNYTPPSSALEIESALGKAGLTAGSGNENQPTNTMTRKALNAYTQTNRQAQQSRIAQSIAGIDIYA